MTIEYIYPKAKRPDMAQVKGKESSFYAIALDEDERHIHMGNGYPILADDVPEVCEAMMKLAGKDVEHACAVDVGKRIVERLQKYIELHDGKTSDEFQDGVKAGYRTAMAVAREESGYDL